MPENNQIQLGFQSEIQVNSQIQQNNSVQNPQQIQESNQQTIKQTEVELPQQDLQQVAKKQVQNIYYHPTRLTKILSGVYRFLGIALIRAGLWNFSLIGSDSVSFGKILYVGGSITLCGILYILLGGLLYNTKKIIHHGISLLGALAVNTMFARILREFTNHNYGYGISSNTSEQLGFCTVLFSVIYYLILTIVWFVKCYRFKKKGVVNQKYLDSTPSKKKVGIITTTILLLIVAVGLIYSKIKWPKIPEIDESIFQRTEHQTKLPDEEDAIIQLKILDDNYGSQNKIIDILNYYYLYVVQSEYSFSKDNKDISWRQHTNECILINSGGNEYCGTWVWNKKTLNRTLNNYFYIGDNGSRHKDFIDYEGYLSIDGKKVTIFEYIHKNELEIKKIFQELDYISSLDYYLSDNEETILPASLQGYSRASMIALLYYIHQKDRDMVTFIIKLNYKIVNIFNNSGNLRNMLISMVIQNIVDFSVNSYIQLFPENFRKELSERYKTQICDKDEIIDKMVKGEFVTRNRARNGVMGDIGKDTPSLFQFLFHFPFYSENEIDRLMVYFYYEFWDRLKNSSKEPTLGDKIKNIPYLYNMFWKYPYNVLIPRMGTINDRIDRNAFHKEALIENLQSGKYDVWFSKPDREANPSNYEHNLLQSIEN